MKIDKRCLPKSENHRNKIRDTLMGHEVSDETKRKIRISLKGRTSLLVGYKHSDQAKKNMSIAQKGRLISAAQKIKMSRAQRERFLKTPKENRPNWEGGITPFRNHIRKLFEYRQWRSDVFTRDDFTRDDFTCQSCYKRGEIIEAHHIKPLSKIITDNCISSIQEALLCAEIWDINNGVTLCKKCHVDIGKESRDL